MKQPWSKDEEVRLAALYPMSPREEILSALPGREWSDIQKKACRLKVKRLKKWSKPDRKPIGPLAPLLATLRRERIARNLNAATISKRAGYAANCVSRWEGQYGSTMGAAALQDWAQAMGFDLVLVPRGDIHTSLRYPRAETNFVCRKHA